MATYNGTVTSCGYVSNYRNISLWNVFFSWTDSNNAQQRSPALTRAFTFAVSSTNLQSIFSGR
jgi:hypothetical protein